MKEKERKETSINFSYLDEKGGHQIIPLLNFGSLKIGWICTGEKLSCYYLDCIIFKSFICFSFEPNSAQEKYFYIENYV